MKYIAADAIDDSRLEEGAKCKQAFATGKTIAKTNCHKQIIFKGDIK